jgi:hypothetical protein
MTNYLSKRFDNKEDLKNWYQAWIDGNRRKIFKGFEIDEQIEGEPRRSTLISDYEVTDFHFSPIGWNPTIEQMLAADFSAGGEQVDIYFRDEPIIR